MSASIMWEPIGGGKDLHIATPSSWMEAMQAAGYGLPCILNSGAVPVLVGMKAATSNAEWRAAFETLIDALEKHDQIRVWAAY